MRVFRALADPGKVGYSSKAEHDFKPPEDFDPRGYATRTDWQLGDPIGRARIWLSDRIDWLVLRHFGHAGTVTQAADADDAPDDGVVFETDYARLAPDGLLGARAWATARASSGRRSWWTRRDERVALVDGAPRQPARAGQRAQAPAPQPRRGADEPNGKRETADPPGALRAPGHARRDPDRGRAAAARS